jgi:Tetratricopeptide repeat/Protein of unknown function (DUF2914)
MTDRPDIQSVMAAAEQAAGAGDFPSAEAFLRQAAELQEGTLGAMHPDLANTLNNLGVVCERLDKPAEAERCYRRASAIATTALAPDHPFAVLSAKNLREFCEARGIPFDPPVPQTPAPIPAKSEPPADRTMGRLPGPEPGSQAPPRVASSRTLLLSALVVCALVAVAVLMWPRSSPVQPTERPRQPSAPAPSAEVPFRTPASPAPGEAAQPPGVASPTETRPRAEGTTATIAPTVIDARLCRTLQTGAEWQCTPIAGTAGEGAVYFYTSVASPRDTTVEHRWYRGRTLHQVVTLRIRPNPAGFRTYSRMTVTAALAGAWHVEVRAADGTLLRTEPFTVGPD